MKPLQPQDWDRDKVWDNIEKALRGRKRRRGLLLFWLGSGVLLAVLAVSLWLVPERPAAINERKKEAAPASFEKVRPGRPEAVPSNARKTTKRDSSGLSRPGGTVSSMEADSLLSQPDTDNPKGATVSSTLLTAERTDTVPAPPVSSPLPRTAGEAPVVRTETLSAIPSSRMAVLPTIDRLSPNPLQWAAAPDLLPAPDSLAAAALPLFFRLETALGVGDAVYEGPNAWKQAREDSESFEYASTSTVGLDWYFAEHWYAFAGLSYQLLRSRYQFTSSQTTVQAVASDSAVVYNFQLSGEQYYEPGVREETRTTRRFIIHNNALHRWSLPLGIGFTQPVGRFYLEARVGARVRVIQHFDGVALDETTQQHILDNRLINERYYRDRPNLDLTASVLLNYHLKAGNCLFLGVQYERGGILEFGSARYRTHYHLRGARLGWRVRW